MKHTHEDFFLLMLDEDDGHISAKNRQVLPIGLAGAILADLFLLGRIEIVNIYLVQVVDHSPTGSPVLDLALSTIQQEISFQTIGRWVLTLAGQSDTYLRLLLIHLTDHCVIQERFPTFLSISREKCYLLTARYVRSWIRLRLRAVVLSATPAEPETSSLLGLLAACNRLSLIFDRSERRFAPGWVGELVARDPVYQAVDLVYRLRHSDKLPQLVPLSFRVNSG